MTSAGIVRFKLLDRSGKPLDGWAMQMPAPGQTVEELRAALRAEFGERLLLDAPME